MTNADPVIIPVDKAINGGKVPSYRSLEKSRRTKRKNATKIALTGSIMTYLKNIFSFLVCVILGTFLSLPFGLIFLYNFLAIIDVLFEVMGPNSKKITTLLTADFSIFVINSSLSIIAIYIINKFINFIDDMLDGMMSGNKQTNYLLRRIHSESRFQSDLLHELVKQSSSKKNTDN